MAQSNSFAQKFCNFIYILLKYLLAIGLTALMCVPVIYHLSNQSTHHVQNRSLYKSFHTAPHQSIKQKLDNAPAAYLYGKQPQQIEHFVDYYALQENIDGWRVIKWEFDGDADLTDYVPVNDIKIELQKYFDVEEQRKAIWVISMNGYREKFYQVRQLMIRYPSDRFIVIAEKKQKIANFAFFEIPQISMKDFENSLKEQLGISSKQASILIKHYGSIHKTMEQIDKECRQLECVLNENYHDISLLSSSQLKKLNSLCINGVYQTQKQIKALDQSGAFFIDGKYYWKNVQSALNFQLQTQNMKPCQFTNSQSIFWIINEVLFDSFDKQQIQNVDNDGITDQQQKAYQKWFNDEQQQLQQNNEEDNDSDQNKEPSSKNQNQPKLQQGKNKSQSVSQQKVAKNDSSEKIQL